MDYFDLNYVSGSGNESISEEGMNINELVKCKACLFDTSIHVFRL